MFYEKLASIYRSTECHLYYPNELLDSFYNFLRENDRSGRTYISPYKFALRSNLTVAETIRFFMYFSNESGIFDIVYFIDCTRSGCSNRVYMSLWDMNSVDSFITCEECEKDYIVKDVIELIKAYFVLTVKIEEPAIQQKMAYTDPNSTFLAMRGLPEHLKPLSPSSSDRTIISTPDGGDSPSISLRQLSESNKSHSGNVIVTSVEENITFFSSYIKSHL